jgi:hypothetical protein
MNLYTRVQLQQIDILYLNSNHSLIFPFGSLVTGLFTGFGITSPGSHGLPSLWIMSLVNLFDTVM